MNENCPEAKGKKKHTLKCVFYIKLIRFILGLRG